MVVGQGCRATNIKGEYKEHKCDLETIIWIMRLEEKETLSN
jgi:hypothetical protein